VIGLHAPRVFNLMEPGIKSSKKALSPEDDNLLSSTKPQLHPRE
jgi:hypothetical protein